MRQRAAILIADEARILLVHRKKAGVEYYVLPGGGLEEGETPEAACVREAQEELGLTVTLGEKLCTLVNDGRLEHYFPAATFAGELRLGGPERERQSDENQYRLEWVAADRLGDIDLKPEAARQLCLDHLRRRSG
jgi:8-oxo-dGTP pyrophosphatase MutT (NUDIX family)